MKNKKLEKEVKNRATDPSFEGQLQRFYQKVVKPDDVVIDVGAHTGRHVLPFSFLTGEAGKIIAIEANPVAAKNLESQLYKFKVKNTDVYVLALSKEVKTAADFYVVKNAPEESGLRQRTVYNAKHNRIHKEKVNVATLDSLNIKGRIRFIKINVEGAEFLVLQGSYQTISANQPVIAFEFGKNGYEAYGVNPGEVYDYFEELQYSIFSIHGELLEKESFVSSSCIQKFWDYIACPSTENSRIKRLLTS